MAIIDNDDGSTFHERSTPPLIKPIMISVSNGFVALTKRNYLQVEILCFWHVISPLDIVRFDEFSKYKTETANRGQGQLLFLTSKIRQFDTYQIAFLMRKQGHKVF